MMRNTDLNKEYLRNRVDERLQRIANFLLINASFITNPGLLRGKMGIVIFMYHYSQYSGNKMYEDYAGELLDEIYEEISHATPVDFENGLTGIGWGIEYLISKDFVEANSDDVLSELDALVYKFRLNSPILIDSISNYFGYGIYHITRLLNDKIGINELRILIKKHHLIFLVDECERILISKRFLDFNITPIKIDIILSLLWFLLKIYKLNLLPGKVKNILKAIPEYLDFIPDQDITIADSRLIKFLSHQVLNTVNEKGITSLYQTKFTRSNSNVSLEKDIDEHIIDDLVSITCMNLIYEIPSLLPEDISFGVAFKFIDDETIWNGRIDDINKDSLSLDGFAGIGFYLLNNISSKLKN